MNLASDTDIMQIKPIQKQTSASQRTRFKAIVVIGSSNERIGLGIKTSKEVATAICAAIIIAKLSVLPIRRGFWGNAPGNPHSFSTEERGKCGSVTVRVSLHWFYAKFVFRLIKSLVYLYSSRYWSCCFTSCQASSAACWCRRRLYRLNRFYQDS